MWIPFTWDTVLGCHRKLTKRLHFCIIYLELIIYLLILIVLPSKYKYLFIIDRDRCMAIPLSKGIVILDIYFLEIFYLIILQSYSPDIIELFESASSTYYVEVGIAFRWCPDRSQGCTATPGNRWRLHIWIIIIIKMALTKFKQKVAEFFDKDKKTEDSHLLTKLKQLSEFETAVNIYLKTI